MLVQLNWIEQINHKRTIQGCWCPILWQVLIYMYQGLLIHKGYKEYLLLMRELCGSLDFIPDLGYFLKADFFYVQFYYLEQLEPMGNGCFGDHL